MSTKKYSNKKNRKEYQSESEEEDEQYEVEKILDTRYNPKTKQKEYLVKWENWPVEDSTWEPVEHLENVKQIVNDFEKNLKKKEALGASIVTSQPAGPHTRINAMKDTTKKGRMTNNSQSKSLPHEEEIPTTKEDNKKQPVKKFQAASSRRKSVSSQSESHSQGEENAKNSNANNNNNDDFEEPNAAESDGTELVFEEIIEKRNSDGQTEYLIRFQNIPQPQWVDVTQLIAIKDDILAFEEKLAKETAEKAAAEKVAKFKAALLQGAKQASVHSDTEDLEEPKDSKKKNLVPMSKRHTAKRSLPFDEEKEKLQVPSKASTVVEKEPLQPTAKSLPRLAQQSSTVSQSSTAAQNLNQQPSSSSMEMPSKMSQLQGSKRKPIDLTDVQPGDFKTDNVDRIELQGDFNDILTARFEIFWKIRQDNFTPASQIYSASYLRRYEPQVLIDYLIAHTNQHQQGHAQQVQNR